LEIIDRKWKISNGFGKYLPVLKNIRGVPEGDNILR
jgi:hypothetical protein